MKKQNIDSKKEFDVSVDAALFICELNKNTEYSCQESDFYSSEIKCDFGWKDNKFMSVLSLNNEVDGISPFVWRQGIKHDCSKVMEIESEGNIFCNKLGERFTLEDNLIYPLLKSSDLKTTVAKLTRKMTIVTQKFIGQNTSYIKEFPQTYKYLNDHIDLFRMRKSSIYKGKCDFSIFGVGEYSFKPYKIAISGLYKTFHFCLVKPQNGKPVMLDDTCYFIGFDTLEQAEYVWELLNSDLVENLLKSITFKDAKRMITKDILMRIDLKKVAEKKHAGLLIAIALCNIVMWIIEKFIDLNFEFLSVSYILSECMLLFLYWMMQDYINIKNLPVKGDSNPIVIIDSMTKAEKINKIILKLPEGTTLSARQIDVLEGILEGKSRKEISSDLFLSENTVKMHISSLYRILGVNNRDELKSLLKDKK
jgi:DNA-binding CsgD family transcriptional regulator